MNVFAFAGLSCASLCFALTIICLIFGRSRLHNVLALFNLATSIWGTGCFIVGLSTTPEKALLGWKIAHVGGVFVSTLFYHLVLIFCKSSKKYFLIFAYTQSVLLVLVNLGFGLLITKTRFVFGIYYNFANALFWV